MQINIEQERQKVAQRINSAFRGEARPNFNSLISNDNFDVDERKSVRQWIKTISATSIETFVYDGSNESSVAFIYMTPRGVKWLLPRYMFDYLWRFDPSKYSIYPIMGQLTPSINYPKRNIELINEFDSLQKKATLDFVEIVKKYDVTGAEFSYSEIMSSLA